MVPLHPIVEPVVGRLLIAVTKLVNWLCAALTLLESNVHTKPPDIVPVVP
jgi:hypothetical protein